MRQGVPRLVLDGLPEGLGRRVGSVLQEQGIPELEVRLGRVGGEGDGPAERLLGRGELPAAQEHLPQFEEGPVRLGRFPDDLVQQFDGLPEPALAIELVGQH